MTVNRVAGQKRWLLAGLVAGALVGIMGGAVAMGAAATPTPKSASSYYQAFTNDLAKILGLPQSKVSSALTQANNDTLNQEVKDGLMTQAQANALQNQGGLSFNFGMRGYEHHGFGMRGSFGGPGINMGTWMSGAATTLGMTQADLQTAMQNGQSLSAIAKTKNISTATLSKGIITVVTTQLDAQVKAGTLTQAQETSTLSYLNANMSALLGATSFRRGPGGSDFDSDDMPGATSGTQTPGTGTSFFGGPQSDFGTQL